MATTPETTEDFHLFKEKPLTSEIRKVEASRMREIDTSCRVIDKMVAVSSVNPWDAGVPGFVFVFGRGRGRSWKFVPTPATEANGGAGTNSVY